MNKKEIVKGYNKFEEFYKELEEVIDLSKLTDRNKLNFIVFKVIGLYINSKDGNYLTGDIYTNMFQEIAFAMKDNEGLDFYFDYVDGKMIIKDCLNKYEKVCAKIISGNFDIDFLSYFYSYEYDNNIEFEKITIEQLLSLRNKEEFRENITYKEKDSKSILGYASVKQIEDDLNNITDLSVLNQRVLFENIMYKLIRLYGYKLLLSNDVYESIGMILSKAREHILNLEYYSDKNPDRTKVERIIGKILESRSNVISSTIDLFYHIGLNDYEEEINNGMKQLSFEELYKLEKSGVNYISSQSIENKRLIVKK